MKKPGPKPKNLKDLRLVGVKSFYSESEIASIDQRRAHHSRAEVQRAAALSKELAAPLRAAFVTSFSETARLRSNMTQLNELTANLNLIKLNEGELMAAQTLREQLPEVLNLIDEFRATLADGKPSRSRSRSRTRT